MMGHYQFIHVTDLSPYPLPSTPSSLSISLVSLSPLSADFASSSPINTVLSAPHTYLIISLVLAALLHHAGYSYEELDVNSYDLLSASVGTDLGSLVAASEDALATLMKGQEVGEYPEQLQAAIDALGGVEPFPLRSTRKAEAKSWLKQELLKYLTLLPSLGHCGPLR
jgi:hypothetical protein